MREGRMKWLGALVGASVLAVAPLSAACQESATMTVRTSDGLTLYGESYFGELPQTSPLVLLFHQAGTSGRGEYEELAHWLNDNGYRAIAWDQRSGGDLHGQPNRTAAAAGAAEHEYCGVYPDLQAALDYAIAQGLSERVVVWGSSYSGALVFQLAARNPGRIAGVVAFSPAGGGPMTRCRPRQWLDSIRVPMVAFRPESEMEVESVKDQEAAFLSAGAEYRVIPNGVHGSSMLLDSRTGSDMSAARTEVLSWLDTAFRGGSGSPSRVDPP